MHLTWQHCLTPSGLCFKCSKFSLRATEHINLKKRLKERSAIGINQSDVQLLLSNCITIGPIMQLESYLKPDITQANIRWLETWHIVLCSLGLSCCRYSLQSPDDVILASFLTGIHTYVFTYTHSIRPYWKPFLCSSLVWSDCSIGLQDKLTSLCYDNPLFLLSQEAWTHFTHMNNHSITFTKWLIIETGYN